VFGAPVKKGAARRYSPPVVVAAEKGNISGTADMATVSTSHVERMNLNIRMGNRRFTSLTNAFSMKLANHSQRAGAVFLPLQFLPPA